MAKLCTDVHPYEKCLQAVEQVLTEHGVTMHLGGSTFLEKDGMPPAHLSDRDKFPDVETVFTLPRSFDTERLVIMEEDDVEQESL